MSTASFGSMLIQCGFLSAPCLTSGGAGAKRVRGWRGASILPAPRLQPLSHPPPRPLRSAECYRQILRAQETSRPTTRAGCDTFVRVLCSPRLYRPTECTTASLAPRKLEKFYRIGPVHTASVITCIQVSMMSVPGPFSKIHPHRIHSCSRAMLLCIELLPIFHSPQLVPIERVDCTCRTTCTAIRVVEEPVKKCIVCVGKSSSMGRDLGT